MNKKIKVILLIFSVQWFFAADCYSRAGKEKIKTKWSKNSAEIKLSLAKEQFEAGQYEQAEEIAKQCLEANPNLPEAKLLLGKIRIADEDYGRAKNYLEDYVNSNDKDDAGLFLLGFVCERQGDNVSAMKWYRKAMDAALGNTDYIIAVGQMYQSAGNFILAEFFYKEKMEANPSNTDLKAAAAQIYLGQGKNDEALRLYEQAVMLKPQSSELLESLGSCYILRKQWGKALEVHERLYSQSDDAQEKTGYLKTMAIAAENAGDYDAAFKYYSALTSQDKHNARLWLSMGQAAVGADLMPEAIVCSRKVLELSPNMKEAWLLSGSANYKNGNYLEAADDFQKAADVPQQAGFALLMAGRCYEKLGRNEDADIAYEKAGQFGTNSELRTLLAKGNEKN